MIKICLFGPESVGKTTLAKQLVAKYGGHFVPEVSQDMINNNNFTETDIIAIGKAQTKAMLKAEKTNNKLIIFDTDLITTQLYAEIYLNCVPLILLELEKKVIIDVYFLLNIDVPWVADGLRDLGDRRAEIYKMFKTSLEIRQINYIDVSGDWENRWKTVSYKIETLLKDFL